ncbi:MAG: GPP34 family phosphoprotein [Actinomycetales bacterium]|nr:GPP34 family phosphoprotein [Actinomycetales bacterium]
MSLLLAEELVLLCMDDDTGHCEVPPQDAARGVALALVFELTLRGFLGVEGEKFALQRTRSSDDPLLDLAAHNATALTPVDAVGKLAAEDLLQATLARLVSRGVLKDAEVWAPGVHLPNDPHPEAAVRDRLRQVLAQEHDPSDHDAALVALLHHLGIVTRVLPDESAETIRTRAEKVAARSRPMRDYQQDRVTSRKRWWDAADLMELLAGGLNIFS